MDTADNAPRANRDGRPCPSWCTENHEETKDSLHRTDRTAINVDGHAGHVSTRAGMFGGEPEVVVHSMWANPEHGHRTELEGNLYVSVADAGQLAGVIEVLALATPDQHRELAAAIRQAAAQIAGEPAASQDRAS